ncbi:MAG: carboxypeptidase regulatory-like domain-containing protein, partial [Actinomycetes bacterium]
MAKSIGSGRAGASWWSRQGKWAVALVVVLLAGVFPRFALAAGAGDFSVTVQPASQTVNPGKTAQYLVEVAVIDGFSSPVTLSARQQDGSPLPAGVSASFKPSSLTGGGSSVMTLSVPTTLAVGTVLRLSVVGTGGGLTRTSDASTAVSFVLVEKCLVTVEGVVTETTTTGGPAGAPVEGATVVAKNNPTLSATTNASGAYRLTNVPLGDNNAPIIGFGVTASKNPPGQNKIGDYWSKAGAADLVCGRTTRIDLSMVKVVPSVLSGNVVEGRLAADGVTVEPVSPAVPVAGARVTALGLAQATTAADGKFAFVDQSGATGVHVGEDNTPISPTISVEGATTDPVRRRFWPVSVTSPVVAAGTVVVVPQVALLRQCTAAVSGKVLNDADGTPVRSATVRIDNADSSDNTSALTATDGTFRIPETLIGKNNAPGKFKVTVFKDGFVTNISSTSTDATCGGSLDVTARIKAADAPPPDPNRIYGSLTGKVIDKETGAPIAGSTVSLSSCRPATTGDCATSPTAADGTFTISRIPVGTVPAPTTTTTLPGATTSSSTTTTTPPPPSLSGTVTAQLIGYWSASATVTVKGGDPTVAPDLAIVKQRTVSVSGTVSGQETQPNGSVVSTGPLQGASVTVSTGICTATGDGTCSTGADGSYAASEIDLGPGNVAANRSVTTSKAGYWTKTDPFTAEIGSPKVIDVKLLKQCTATIVGTVRNASTLLPIAGATVSVPSGNQFPASTPSNVVTSADGTFVISNVLLGVGNTDRSIVVTGAAPGFYNSTLSA